MTENIEKHVSAGVEADVLNRLRAGPLPLRDCQSLRIAPTTLKGAVWSLRRKGHKIEAQREAEGMRQNVYSLVDHAD